MAESRRSLIARTIINLKFARAELSTTPLQTWSRSHHGLAKPLARTTTS